MNGLGIGLYPPGGIFRRMGCGYILAGVLRHGVFAEQQGACWNLGCVLHSHELLYTPPCDES